MSGFNSEKIKEKYIYREKDKENESDEGYTKFFVQFWQLVVKSDIF